MAERFVLSFNAEQRLLPLPNGLLRVPRLKLQHVFDTRLEILPRLQSDDVINSERTSA